MAEVYRLSNAEREVILSWTGEDDTIHVTAEIPAFHRLLVRRGYSPDPDGFFRIPVSALAIRSANRTRRQTTAANLEALRRGREKAALNRANTGPAPDSTPETMLLAEKPA